MFILVILPLNTTLTALTKKKIIKKRKNKYVLQIKHFLIRSEGVLNSVHTKETYILFTCTDTYLHMYVDYTYNNMQLNVSINMHTAAHSLTILVAYDEHELLWTLFSFHTNQFQTPFPNNIHVSLI